ncbi:MAG: DUF6434 domain-containing protein [Pseudomonadota bacterium]
MSIDWHSAPLSAETPLDDRFRKTQNVRRTLRALCGPEFKFDRALMAWIDSGAPKTLGDIAAEWRRRA